MSASTKRRIIIAVVVAILALPPVALAMMSIFGSRPDNLGVHDGRLAECPNKPNCVCSQCDDSVHAIEPIAFEGTPDAALERLRTVVADQPRTVIISDDDGYIHAEATSGLFRFVDDVEFLVAPTQQVIQVRSASRVGYSDFDVNRKRIEAIRKAFDQAGA